MRGLLNYSVVASKLNKQSGEKLCGTYQNAADLSAVACLSTIAWVGTLVDGKLEAAFGIFYFHLYFLRLGLIGFESSTFMEQ